jgi:predicted ATPase/class 3 adenylate cyclase
MQCPACGTANPAQARFCLGCGRLLVNGIICANCHTLLPLYARYCFHCGAMAIAAGMSCPQCGAALVPGQARCGACGAEIPNLSPIPMAEGRGEEERPEAMPAPALAAPSPGLTGLLPSLQRYLPQELYEPLERRPTEKNLAEVAKRLEALLRTTRTYLPRPVAQDPQPAGQPAGGMFRGTFLFGDVSGFTPLSERLSRFGKAGAERVTEIINSLFLDLVTILDKHGGVLLKFGGDALLGLFPADSDQALAAGALQAIQAAMAMQANMGKFAAIEAGGQTFPLRIKCGISSGPYFAAHLGTVQRMAYVTTGHTVNRADQAEGNAAPGDVVIAQSTLDLVSDRVAVELRANGFYLVREAPPPGGDLALPPLLETPTGDLPAQIACFVERMDRLAPYLAADLLPRIVTNPDQVQISPDHRPVTVMFANYLGVSDLIDDMGTTRPDLITRHLNDYFVHMAQVVEHYEGTLARMDQYSVGDRLVIFFGAPHAHEDDPVRAVYTALDMQEATRQHFAALQAPEGIYRFRQRIGINSGSLFAGNVGAPNLRQEYTLMGDDINMAARLMSKAGWQEIFISKKTQEKVSAYFNLESRGELKVKGKEVLIPTFQVLSRREEIGRTRGLESGDSPLTGRDDDLETLKSCGQGLLGGRGQIVALVSDSGLGKSRLLREFENWMLENGDRKLEGDLSSLQPPTSNLQSPVLWLSGQSLSFSEQTSYWLAVQVLQAALGLQSGASSDDILFTLWETGEELLGKETAREAIPFLAHLLDLPLKDDWARWVQELDPRVRQKQTFWAAREFFAAAARKRPIVIALDDLHWADEASLALVEDLLAVTDHAPLMLALVFRPRRDKGCWRLRDKAAASFPHRFTEVELQPLDEAHSQQLLARLLPGAEFTSAAEQEILDKAAGNPFYIEEVVRSLLESGAVVPDMEQPGRWQVTARIEQITVPDTLQSAIVARIDRLTEDARQALQMAAVIGRRFQVELLRNLAQAEAQLDSWLAQLERSGLIRPTGLAAEPAYAFPDALVQEVAYESLRVQRRQQFHKQIGEALENVFAGRIEEGCELLAYHFGRSDDPERGMQYLEMAGRKAQAEFANETALRHYSDLLERLGETEETWARRADVLARRQQILGLLGRQEARQVDLEAMRALAEAHNDAARRSDALNGLADLYQWTGRYAEAEAAAREALAIKTGLGDQAGQAAALHQLGVLDYYRGNYEQARPVLEQAAALRQAIQDAEGETWSVMYLYMIHLVQGSYVQAAELNGRALQVSEARQDWFQRGIHLTNAARISLRLGEYEAALKQFQESLEMKARVGDRTGQGFALFGIGLAQVYLGRYDQAEAAFQESLTLRRQINDERGIGYCLHGLGLAALGRGRFAQAEDLFQQAYEVRSRLGLKAETIADLSYIGQARLGLGNLDAALRASTQAMVLLAEQKSVEEVQQIYLNHYRVLAAQGDPTAGDYWQKAHAAMMEQAQRLPEGEKRQAFLEKVQANQEITAAGAGRTR